MSDERGLQFECRPLAAASFPVVLLQYCLNCKNTSKKAHFHSYTLHAARRQESETNLAKAQRKNWKTTVVAFVKERDEILVVCLNPRVMEIKARGQ